ncbi:hypothetical protein NK8_64780 (plasmid) [Caballeronia sp. NK8]|uniref:hypothetical protein n=1 Tax=Caballeronia sp. NK8 TaxID=140098 RepID=UPI001BB48CF7|nr:hypothetical protein [Caballeronia sp. NK8]BCQ28289.1 hypothetical protein NK8_64780 [Caballeronia sp. NK8]
MDNDFRVRLLLSLQVALLGNISANMRAVTCRLEGSDIKVRAMFDGAVSEEDSATVDEIGSELASHFDHEMVDVECLRVDAPQPISTSNDELIAYRRKEA